MKRILSMIMISLFTFTILSDTCSFAKKSEDLLEDLPDVSAESVIVMDAKTGQVLYDKDGHSKRYPASITKIMTALLAIEKGDLTSIITMSEDAVWGIERGSSHIALDVGEQISLKDALYATLLVSANEASWAIAEHISGSLTDFCTLMNQRALELGCENTNFVNANGLHDDNHYTTAYDMALITRQALKNETFMEITACTYHEIKPTNLTSDIRYLWQDNKLINEGSDYYYKYCQGGKTGYTDEAGGTLVTWATQGDMQLICVTMNGSPSSVNYTDSVALFDYFFDNYMYVTPLEGYEFSAEQLTSCQNFLNEYYDCENLGTLKLTIDTTKTILYPYNKSIDELDLIIECTTDRLESGVIGDLKVSYGDITYMKLPITYSGYVNSNDKEAIAQARKDGTLRISPPNLGNSSFPVFIVIVIVLIISGVAVYLRLQYVRKQRVLNDLKRKQAHERLKAKNTNIFDKYRHHH